MRRIILTWLMLCAALFGAWQANAQMSLTGAGCASASCGGGGGVTWNPQAATTCQTNTTVTWSSLTFGTGLNLAIIGNSNNRTVSSVTINGVSATQSVGETNLEIWQASTTA